MESGAYALTEQPLAQAEQSGAAFAAKAGCAGPTDAQTAACLRALPVATILADQNAAGYQPDIDGSVLTQSIGTALASGQFNRVPIINGSNHDEWRLFVALDTLEGQPPVTAANYVTSLGNELGLPPAVAQKVAAEYPVSSFPSAPVAAMARPARTRCSPARRWRWTWTRRSSCRCTRTSSATRTRRNASCRRSASRTARRTRPRSSTCSTSTAARFPAR